LFAAFDGDDADTGDVQRLLDELAALSPAPNVVLGGQFFAANPLPVSLHRGCVSQ